MNNIINKLPNSFDAKKWVADANIISEHYNLNSQYNSIRHLILKSDLGIFKVISYDLEWKNIIISKNEVTLYFQDNQIINFIDEINITECTNNSFVRSIILENGVYKFVKYPFSI